MYFLHQFAYSYVEFVVLRMLLLNLLIQLINHVLEFVTLTFIVQTLLFHLNYLIKKIFRNILVLSFKLLDLLLKLIILCILFFELNHQFIYSVLHVLFLSILIFNLLT